MIRVTAAIIEHADQVLCARRKPGVHLEGYWEFPGGKIENNETPEQCLIRELHEEFGINARVGSFVGESIHDYGSKRIQLLAYRVPAFQGSFQLRDHDAIEWRSVEALDGLRWAPADIPLVNQYKAQYATQAYYEQHAVRYAAETGELDLAHLTSPFLSRLSPGASLLDLGCGSGRDSATFLDKGFRVVSMDRSPNMALQAEQRIKQPVRVGCFTELDDREAFDGVWANASLLHSPRGQIQDVLHRVIRSLKPGGLLFVSVKQGEGESYDSHGRHVSYYTPDSFHRLIQSTGALEILDCWDSETLGEGGTQPWINCVMQKKRS